MKTVQRLILATLCALAVCAAVAVLLPVAAHAQAPATAVALTEPQAAEVAIRKITLTVGLSKIIESPMNIQRASVALPDVIEFVAVSPKELLLNGKKEGETSLILWEQGGQRILFDVTILPNPSKVDAVRHQLKDELAGQDVELYYENNTPFLRGTVKDLTSSERAVSIATTLGKPVNLLRVTTPPPQTQILLKVRFADVDRSVQTEYGINFFRNGNTVTTGALSTSQFNPTSLSSSNGTQTGGAGAASASGFTITSALNLFLYNKSIDLGALVNFLEAKNVLQILAEPNVLAIDGKAASFLAGGEFPYPTLGSTGGGASQVSISFRRFGVSIDFVPHITSRGTIRLEVTPEVSSLDYANGLVFEGFNIPALDTRRVQTEIELESGQSFAIGGLLDNRVTQTLNKIPGLSNIPLLGKLFESRSTQKSKTELLVLVTPEIVRPVPADQPAPSLGYPIPFMHEGGDALPRTPGMDKTGPVPVTPPSPTVAVETLVEEKNRDKSRQTTQPQMQLLGVPITPAPATDPTQPPPSGSTATPASTGPEPPMAGTAK
ncbi:MAG TPA: pilus assembly protein N-terminal domain-containing protein [Bryobacteraceae bacterium]|jgi:pilus assembly protein CpaC